MRFWVYDETGALLRKFSCRADAERYLDVDYKLVVQPKQKRILPNVEQYGEALW